MQNQNWDTWTRISATVGAAVWSLLVTLAAAQKAPLGVIELLFLFAPLVIVPLGMALGGSITPPAAPRIDALARAMQPFAAGLAVISFWLSPGLKAGVLVAPWAAVCGLVALQGLLSLRRGARTLPNVAVNIGRMDLALAAVGLLVSRGGIHAMSFQEPIVLLTAVHFHYTGFATSLLAGTVLDFASREDRAAGLLKWPVLLIVFAPFVVATGFVFSPALKLAGVLLLSLGVTGMSLVTLGISAKLQNATARAFIRFSSMAVLGGMALAVVYGIGDALGKNWLLIPRMASTHGPLNGLGFVLPGLLGWLAEQPVAGKH